MPWAYIDDRFPEHPKVEALDDDVAAWLWVKGICYVKRNGTAGRIPKPAAARMVRSGARRAAKLVAVGLWDDADDSYVIHDYEQWNGPSEQRRIKARRAAEARWGTTPKDDAPSIPQALPLDHPSNANGNAQPGAEHMPPDAPPARIPSPQSPVPSTSTSQSSIPPLSRPAAPDDDRDASGDEDPRIAAALELLTEAAYTDRLEAAADGRAQPIRNATAWRQADQAEQRRAHAANVAALAAVKADATPRQLADWVTPQPAASNAAPARHPLDPTAAAAQERARRDMSPPCPTCGTRGGDGLLIDDAGTAQPCPDCAASSARR